ncbi:unnamed protein product, partial [Anisakis simplex]|uniref:PUB domain-containing protein n=1 Tax=Anisakis simplex TaxID=6269 RepID=A0A0M3JMS8_ANISI
MKELEEEERRAREQERNEERGALAQENRNEEIDVREFEHSNAINGVFFTCELLGDDIVLTKNEMKQNVEEFLRSQMHEDSVVASTLMLFSLNATDKRQTACETLQKYIQNVLEHPDEAKFRRIRLANKAFQ